MVALFSVSRILGFYYLLLCAYDYIIPIIDLHFWHIPCATFAIRGFKRITSYRMESKYGGMMVCATRNIWSRTRDDINILSEKIHIPKNDIFS